VITSPYPPAECGQRLERVTVKYRPRQYSVARAGRPAPRLRGQVSPARVRVAQPLDYSRNSLVPWFDGVLEMAPDGGTILRGTVGLPSASLPAFVFVSAVWAVVIGALLAHGARTLAAGNPLQALPPLLIPCGMLAAYAVVVALTPRQLRSQTWQLLNELSGILGQ